MNKGQFKIPIMKKLTILLTVSLTIALGLAGCNSTGETGNTGTMSVAMTDAPANYDAVTVTINSIRVNRQEDAETDSAETDQEAEEDGWVTIMEEPMQVNLLELTNGNRITLGSEEVETGSYQQIRLILGDDNTVTVDGETYALQTPSAQQSGLKLNVDAEVEENASYNLLLDFDAARSIVKQGNGGYLLKPVIRAVHLAESGSLAGSVQPSDFNTNVLAVMDGDTVTSTITGDNGAFEIIGLAPNSNYEVVFDPSSDQYADTTLTGVEVASGETNDLGTIELQSQ